MSIIIIIIIIIIIATTKLSIRTTATERDGHNDGSLHIDDVSAAASVVYGAVLVTGMQHLLLGTSGDLANRADAISNVILRGIGGKPTPRQSRRTTTGGT